MTHGDLPFPAKSFAFFWLQRINGTLFPEYQGTPGHPILVERQTLLRCLSQGEGQTVRQRLLADRYKHHNGLSGDNFLY
ncbi:hypothetical protein ACLK2H_16250 [Escherichia coli]